MATTNAMLQSRIGYIQAKTGTELLVQKQNHGDGITWYTLVYANDYGRYFTDRRFRKAECFDALCRICDGIDLAQNGAR